MNEADIYSTAVCRLFLRLPRSIPEPMHKNQDVRDSHWYISQLLNIWYEDRRRRDGSAFRRMPWYREKVLCTEVGENVKHRARLAIRNRLGLYGINHKEKLWDLVEEELGPVALKQYADYRRKLARHRDIIERVERKGKGPKGD